MPAAAIIPAISTAVGAGGSIASGMGGKSAQSQANQLASKQLGLEQGMFKQAGNLLQPASDYWSALMHGGQAAVQATGPIASQLGQAAEGSRRAILASTPRGGEQNLAIAQNYNDLNNNIARLYSGMQPMAAQGLQGIGGAYLGAGQGMAYPASMTGLGASQMGMNNAQTGALGFGSALYSGLNKLQGQLGKKS